MNENKIDWNKIKFVAAGRDCTWGDTGRYIGLSAWFAAILIAKTIIEFPKKEESGHG